MTADSQPHPAEPPGDPPASDPPASDASASVDLRRRSGPNASPWPHRASRPPARTVLMLAGSPAASAADPRPLGRGSLAARIRGCPTALAAALRYLAGLPQPVPHVAARLADWLQEAGRPAGCAVTVRRDHTCPPSNDPPGADATVACTAWRGLLRGVAASEQNFAP